MTLMTRCCSAGCGISDDGCCVAIDATDSGSVCHLISTSFFARMFSDLSEVNTIECRRKSRSVCTICGLNKVADPVLEADMQAEQIYPQVQQPRRSAEERALLKKKRQLSCGLQACKVRVKAPRPQKPSKQAQKPDYTSSSDTSHTAEESDQSIAVGGGQADDVGDAADGGHADDAGDAADGGQADDAGDAADGGQAEAEAGGQSGGQEVGGVITWTVPGHGDLKYSVASQLLAAHCCLGGSEFLETMGPELAGLTVPWRRAPLACW